MGEIIDIEEDNQMQQLVQGDALFESTEKLIFEGKLQSGDVEIIRAAGILTFNELRTHMAENPNGINGLPMDRIALITREAEEIVALRRAESNLTKTMSIIGRKAQRQQYDRNCARIRALQIAITLDTRGPGQIAHWRRELAALKTRNANY